MRRIASSLIAAAALAAVAPAGGADLAADATDPFAPTAPPELAADERARLETGEVVIRRLEPSDGRGIGLLAMGLVDAPPDAVWAVMRSCDDQDEYMPRVAYAAERDRDGAACTCDLVFDMPYPIDDWRSETRQRERRLPDGGWQRSWHLASRDGSYERNHGSWSVRPYAPGGGDATRTLLVTRMDLLPKAPLPAWILRAAQTRQAPATFDAIRARVRERRGGEAAPRRADAPDPGPEGTPLVQR